jgi:ABC-2 type transport system ATP-binding protein
VAAITVDALRKTYHPRGAAPVQAVRDVSFSVGDGECLAILGPNGAGKTTALEVLEGYQRRDSGAVEVLGRDPADPTRRWREDIGIVLQSTAVDPYLTVREVLQRNAGYYPRPRPVDEVLALVGLGDKAAARVNKLSGGQQRRLDVGLGIVGRPKLLFLDEPTTGFDPSARRGAWDLVRDLRGLGTTIVLTTHYMDEAQALADRIVVIALGTVVATGTPGDLGGRDTAAAIIRFRLPPGVQPPPLDGLTADEHGFALTTSDEVRVVHELTGWALDSDTTLLGLTVDRPSLEDIYLRLVATTEPPA